MMFSTRIDIWIPVFNNMIIYKISSNLSEFNTSSYFIRRCCALRLSILLFFFVLIYPMFFIFPVFKIGLSQLFKKAFVVYKDPFEEEVAHGPAAANHRVVWTNFRGIAINHH